MLCWVEHEKMLAFSYLLAEKISCSAELSMRKVATMGPEQFVYTQIKWCRKQNLIGHSHYENKPIQIYGEFYWQKTKTFRWKILVVFKFLLKNIDFGYLLELPRRGSSKHYRYPQSMFLSRDKKNNVYPCKPQFYYIRVGLKGVKTI